MVDDKILALREELNAKRLQKARLNMEIRDLKNRIFRIKWGSKSRRRTKRIGDAMTEAETELNPVDDAHGNGAAVGDGDKVKWGQIFILEFEIVRRGHMVEAGLARTRDVTALLQSYPTTAVDDDKTGRLRRWVSHKFGKEVKYNQK